jgi:hypothetical protein
MASDRRGSFFADDDSAATADRAINIEFLTSRDGAPSANRGITLFTAGDRTSSSSRGVALFSLYGGSPGAGRHCRIFPLGNGAAATGAHLGGRVVQIDGCHQRDRQQDAAEPSRAVLAPLPHHQPTPVRQRCG